MAPSARELLGPGGPLARSLDGYEARAGQLHMADAVAAALDEDRVLLCEAGTGTGKTLAYLVPAILSGRKVVVSTATKALEEQIFLKDVPLLARHLGLEPRAAMVKGLENYLCLRRFHELSTSTEATQHRALPLVAAWSARTESGDAAELSFLREGDPLWREISSSSETRVGSRCAHFERCFVTRMRRDAEQARLLIVNHHLFFADLALRGPHPGGALPDYDAVIFDEAHQIEDIASDFFGARVTSTRVEAMLRDGARALLGAGVTAAAGSPRDTALTASVRALAQSFFAKLVLLSGGGEGRTRLPEAGAREGLSARYHALDDALLALVEQCESRRGVEAIDVTARRAAQLRDDLARILADAGHDVAWVDVRPRSVSLGASPVHVGALLRERVFERVGSVVLTSATLAAAGDFAFLRSRLGLEGLSRPVDELLVASPFDFARAALLYVPRDLPHPGEGGFLDAAARRVLELVRITGGGAFVLCTSVRGMTGIAERIRAEVGHPLLVQGEAPKQALLSRFRSAGDAVLVATMTFWEGVDVPGRALRLVVLDKIPFAVPSDPVVAARGAALEASGGNSFRDYTLPDAALTLKQGFGRLIRSGHDRGVVAVLDGRLHVRGYGRRLLASLPPAGRTHALEEVRAFWAAVAPDTGPA